MVLKVMAYMFLTVAFFMATPAVADSEFARGVHEELNLARTNPQRYAGYLEQFRTKFRGKRYRLDRHTWVETTEGVKAVDEAIRFLSRAKPLPPLTWSAGLAKSAGDLAKEQAESGSTGHNARSGTMQERIERHGQWSGKIGENIGYGPSGARQMVMQLIIDDGVSDRGHRKNIFNRSFTKAGVACGPHPMFGTMCAMDFAAVYDP